MITLNSFTVVILCAISKLAIFKRTAALIARALGYGYDIEDDDE